MCFAGDIMKKTSKRLVKRLRSSQRVQYPENEARHFWLSTLLDAYHVLDVGISIELKQEEENRRVSVTCRKGCSNCCLRPILPGVGQFSALNRVNFKG